MDYFSVPSGDIMGRGPGRVTTYRVNGTQILVFYDNANYFHIVTESSIGLRGGGGGCVGCYVIYNETYSPLASISFGGGYTIQANLSGITASVEKPFTQQYVLGIPEYKTVSAPAPPVPTSPKGLNISALFGNSTFTVKNYNKTLSGLGLDVMINWNGFIVPNYVIAILILIVAIVILAASKEEEGIIIGLVILYAADIFQIELIPLSAIVTIVFLVYRVAKQHKGDNDG
jgi:hypothetical protein